MIILYSIILLLIISSSLANNLEGRSAVSCALGWNYVSNFKDYDKLVPFWEVQDYVFIYLYTKTVPSGEIVELNDESLALSEFNSSRPTKIITHGYLNYLESDACTLPRDAFLECCDYNVFVIDWWGMISYNRKIMLPYDTACKYVPVVGNYVARLINFLESHGMNLETTTLIGHSLGAHVMGIAGYEANNTVNCIIGLDPAGPNFESKESFERLSTDDAATVLAIHTNEGDCGISQPVGHYDFYPNGGNKQPGCWMNTCAHNRAVELYVESINSTRGFYGRQCRNLDTAREGYCFGYVIKMDENLRKQEKAEEGVYYFETNDSPPYALEEQFSN